MTPVDILSLFKQVNDIAKRRAREIADLKYRFTLEELLAAAYMQATFDIAESQAAMRSRPSEAPDVGGHPRDFF